jgi:hypothetical protein
MLADNRPLLGKIKSFPGIYFCPNNAQPSALGVIGKEIPDCVNVSTPALVIDATEGFDKLIVPKLANGGWTGEATGGTVMFMLDEARIFKDRELDAVLRSVPVMVARPVKEASNLPTPFKIPVSVAWPVKEVSSFPAPFKTPVSVARPVTLEEICPEEPPVNEAVIAA